MTEFMSSDTDHWKTADNHPVTRYGASLEPAINCMSLRQLVGWAESEGLDLDDVIVDYKACGSHLVELRVRPGGHERTEGSR